MAEIRIKPCGPISAEIQVPGDKSISHRAVMMASLADGDSIIRGFLPSEDCWSTVNAFRSLGVTIKEIEDESYTGEGAVLKVSPPRKGGFKTPAEAIDCGNSGTTMRLLSGILAGQKPGFSCELRGDSSLSSRPMRRILDPLKLMGADITAKGKNGTAPLVIRGAELRGIDYELPVASAQVKSAILFASLGCKGKTTITEPVPTRNHTERMLEMFRVKTVRQEQEITIWGGQNLFAHDFTVPGDISSAAFWVAAAAAMPGAHLNIREVGLNETRTGVLKILIHMGAEIKERLENSDHGEPIGSVEVHGGGLKGTIVEGEDIPNVIDEIPIIAVAGALAEGTTTIRDAKELRVKESDRIATVVKNLRLMGVEVEEFFDGMRITGGARLRGAHLDSHGDHRIAMAFAIAGLFAEGETVIENTDCVNTSYPGFVEHLKKITSTRQGDYTPVISSMNASGH